LADSLPREAKWHSRARVSKGAFRAVEYYYKTLLGSGPLPVLGSLVLIDEKQVEIISITPLVLGSPSAPGLGLVPFRGLSWYRGQVAYTATIRP
jgi:hypothetical protein